MTNTEIVVAAANAVKVSATLLLAVCSHESGGLKNVMIQEDGGSPTYGICGLKEDTAKMVGYTGYGSGLMSPNTNALFAAKYLKWQMDRYDNSWCKGVAAYNAGRFVESKILPGKPKNLHYVRKVQARLEKSLQNKLSCDIMEDKEIAYYE